MYPVSKEKPNIMFVTTLSTVGCHQVEATWMSTSWWMQKQNTGLPQFIVLYFITLHWYLCVGFSCFLIQIEGLWQSRTLTSLQCHSLDISCSLRVSVSHFGNSHNISDFIFVTVSSLCYYCNWVWHFLAVKYFKIKVCTKEGM